MNIEDQVISLELAKQLKEIGVKQDSFFYYLDDKKSENQPCYILDIGKTLECEDSDYSAFTASELMVILPHEIVINECRRGLELKKYGALCVYKIEQFKNQFTYTIGYEKYHYMFSEQNLSDALADMIIHLVKNKKMELNNEKE